MLNNEERQRLDEALLHLRRDIHIASFLSIPYRIRMWFVGKWKQEEAKRKILRKVKNSPNLELEHLFRGDGKIYIRIKKL